MSWLLLGSLLKLAFVLLLLQLLHIFLATTYVYIFNGAKLVKNDDRWIVNYVWLTICLVLILSCHHILSGIIRIVVVLPPFTLFPGQKLRGRDNGLHKKKSKSCVRDAGLHNQPHLKDVSVCRVSAEHPHYPASAHKCLPGCVCIEEVFLVIDYMGLIFLMNEACWESFSDY